MRTNEIFSIKRFALLCKQNLIHSYKMISMSLVGFCGGLFILLLILQSINGFNKWSEYDVFVIFLFITIPLAIVFAGTAFPGFRSKEKSQNYLVNPASLFEKYVFEILFRVLVFILVVPVLFWMVYYIESYFVVLLYKDYQIAPFSLMEIRKLLHLPQDLWQDVFINTCGVLIFVIPFTGASIFSKYPLIKTLFALAIILFFNVFLVYFFVQILGLQRYQPPESGLLFILKDPASIFRAMAIGGIIMSIALMTATYFKLREREV